MLVVLAGPPLVGKSPIAESAIRPDRGDVLIDYSIMFAAMTTVPRGRLRPSRVPVPFVQSVREHAIREAVARQLSGVVTVASGTALEGVRALMPSAPVLVIDADRAAIDKVIAAGPEARQSYASRWREDCAGAAGRWYETYLQGDHDLGLSESGALDGAFVRRFESDNADLVAAFENIAPLLPSGYSPKYYAFILEKLIESGDDLGPRLVAALDAIDTEAGRDALVALATAEGWING